MQVRYLFEFIYLFFFMILSQFFLYKWLYRRDIPTQERIDNTHTSFVYFSINLTENDLVYVYDKLHDFRDMCNRIKRVVVVTRSIAFIIYFPITNSNILTQLRFMDTK